MCAAAKCAIVDAVRIRAIAFDVGGVLERVESPDLALTAKWRVRLGMGEPEFRSAVARVDPDDLVTTGHLSEAEYRQRYADALGLSPAQTDDFMADLWDWYCGELDAELVAYAAALRPQFGTAILSNSADGARREEEARYSFSELVDTIIYSDEVGLAKPDPRIFELTCRTLSVAPDELIFLDDVPENVAAACRFGIHGIAHRSTPESIAAIDALIGR
jgi:epoxide hydrolase-like predicted phosphatase